MKSASFSLSSNPQAIDLLPQSSQKYTVLCPENSDNSNNAIADDCPPLLWLFKQ
jgi:hypothetical protein